MKKVIDLGCGTDKYSSSFGVDFRQVDGVDLAWDLNKELPEEHHGKYDEVYSKCVLDHLGNPLKFLKGCHKYLKEGGRLVLIIDNGDYWRYHFHLGNYHAKVWEVDCPDKPYTHHKMMFQMKHLTKLLGLLGFEMAVSEYFRDYKGILKGHIDYLLPKHLGCNMMRIECIKKKAKIKTAK